MTFPVTMTLIMVLILHEQIFVTAIDGKCDSRNAQTGEGTLEPIPSRERSCISPFFSVYV